MGYMFTMACETKGGVADSFFSDVFERLPISNSKKQGEHLLRKYPLNLQIYTRHYSRFALTCSLLSDASE